MTDPSFFTKQKKLIRVIHPANQIGNRASSAAFERIVKRGKKEEGLSVFCSDIESFDTIVSRIHVFKDAKNIVSTSEMTVSVYNSAANKVSPNYVKSNKDGSFSFAHGGTMNPCYVCKPSKSMGNSHSEVMYLQFVGELQEKVIAQTLANKSLRKIKRTKIGK
jgi:hypothetical protein